MRLVTPGAGGLVWGPGQLRSTHPHIHTRKEENETFQREKRKFEVVQKLVFSLWPRYGMQMCAHDQHCEAKNGDAKQKSKKKPLQ